jgi:cytochrome c-type biogenesis protein CcmH
MDFITLVIVFLSIAFLSLLLVYFAGDIAIAGIRRIGASRVKAIAASLAAVLALAAVGLSWRYLADAKQRAQTQSAVSVSNAAPQVTAAAKPGGDLNTMATRLEARLRAEPNDAQGQALLARTLMELARFNEAASAYAKAVALLPEDLALRNEMAEAEYQAQGKRWTPSATALIRTVLERDANNHDALWLAGKERFENKDYRKAVQYWERVQRFAPAEGARINELQAALVEAKALRDGVNPAMALANAGISAPPLASTPLTNPLPAVVAGPGISPTIAITKEALAAELRATLAQVESASATATAPALQTSIQGTISIDPRLNESMSGNDVLFVFARSAAHSNGPPLAVISQRSVSFPAPFELSDNNAMTPGTLLSSANEVIVTARISRHGDAKAAAGDIEGVSGTVKAGTRNIKIVINKKL